MSATRDPDRILRAWLDQMPDEAPDRAIAAVLQATAAAPQLRAWPGIGRWRIPMNRLTIVAAGAALIVALVGGAIVFVGSNNPSLPTAAPTPTAASTPTPTPTNEPVVPAADALWGLWIAEAETIPGLPNQGPRLGMGFNWDGGRDFSIGTTFGGDTEFFTSEVLGSPSGQFRLRARDDVHGCAAGDVGTYGWQRSANGLFLSVTLVNDQCALRRTTLARTWVRTLGVANDGRTGMATAGDPYPDIQVTLPSRPWAMDALPPVDIHTQGDPGRDFIIYVNPQGLGEPCSTPGSKPFALQPTADALKTYLEGLPGMGAVSSKAVTIDGKPATHLTSTVGECQDAELALFTQPAFPGSNGGAGEVRAPKGMAVSLWTIVHNGDLVVIWYAGDNIPAAEEQAVIDSLRITDGLPTP